MIILNRHWGDTRSQKEVCSYDTDDMQFIEAQTKEYKIPDRFDAVCIFEFRALQSLRQYGEDSVEFERMHMMQQFHRSQMSDEQFANEMESLGLVTSIDIRNHGESLIKHFLRE